MQKFARFIETPQRFVITFTIVVLLIFNQTAIYTFQTLKSTVLLATPWAWQVIGDWNQPGTGLRDFPPDALSAVRLIQSAHLLSFECTGKLCDTNDNGGLEFQRICEAVYPVKFDQASLYKVSLLETPLPQNCQTQTELQGVRLSLCH